MLAERVVEWTEQWKQQGLREGLQRGEIAVLERLLRKRFGGLSAEQSACLHSASLEQLESWTDRVLDAPTLQAVLDGH